MAVILLRLQHRLFRRPYLIFGRPWQITASIGIVIYPKDGRNAESLLKKADLAMYKAKAAGKNNFKHFQTEHRQ